MLGYNSKKGESKGRLRSTDAGDLVEQFSRWMRYHRGAAEPTIRKNATFVSKLIASLGDNPAAYDASGIRSFFLARAGQHSPRHAGAIAGAVRMYLRFLVIQGLCASDLVAAVPSIASWRLSSIPRYLPAEQVERIIASCDLASMAGARDRAALFLLARLGLRAGDVAGLRLEDLDWPSGKLRVMGKGRRETWLPLPQEVGEAMLHYLEHFRPAVQDNHVLLRVMPPYRGLQSKRSLYWYAAPSSESESTPHHSALTFCATRQRPKCCGRARRSNISAQSFATGVSTAPLTTQR